MFLVYGDPPCGLRQMVPARMGPGTFALMIDGQQNTVCPQQFIITNSDCTEWGWEWEWGLGSCKSKQRRRQTAKHKRHLFEKGPSAAWHTHWVHSCTQSLTMPAVSDGVIMVIQNFNHNLWDVSCRVVSWRVASRPTRAPVLKRRRRKRALLGRRA